MIKTYDVIIAGGGPVGLFVAAELGGAGLDVLVLEEASDMENPLRMVPMGFRGLNGTSVEALYRRGLLHKIDLHSSDSAFNKGLKNSQLAVAAKLNQEEGNEEGKEKGGARFGGVFAGNYLDINLLEPARFKYRIPGPSFLPAPTSVYLMEKVLSERAESLGVKILRGQSVEKLTAFDDDGVTVQTAAKGERFRGSWLVGTDGAHSTIRRLAAFRFEGTEATFTGYTAHCEFEPDENLKKGFVPTGNGMYLNDVPGIIHLIHPESGVTAWDRKLELTHEHFQDTLNTIRQKTDVKITKIYNSRSWTDRTKQATTYRRGRVLLAGDAAHTHSPLGGQGLNMGLGDAVNLGWKLAATIKQEKSLADKSKLDLTLLDTYDSERRNFGAWLLGITRVQNVAMQPGPLGAALQSLLRDLHKTADWTNLIMGKLQGLSIRYDLGDGSEHPLIGGSAPDFQIVDGTRLGPKLGRGKGLLVDLNDDAELKELVVEGGYGKQVEYCPLQVKASCDLQSLLIRPDGIVVWLTEEGQRPDIGAAKRALEYWFKY